MNFKEKGRYLPYAEDKASKSPYLRPGDRFPLDVSDLSYGHRLLHLLSVEKIVQFQPTHVIHSKFAAHVRDLPHGLLGTPRLQDSLLWLGEGDASGLLSFDVEIIDQGPHDKYPYLLLLGTITGKTLIIELSSKTALKTYPDLPQPLVDFIRDRAIIGADLAPDLDHFPNLSFNLSLDVRTISKVITTHPLSPWHNPKYKFHLSNKCGLKFLPMLIFGENYGPFYNHPIFNDYCKTWPHPHILSLHASKTMAKMYDWTFPLSAVQRSYCRNDALSPFTHLLTLLTFRIAAQEINIPDTDFIKRNWLNAALGATSGFFSSVFIGHDISRPRSQLLKTALKLGENFNSTAGPVPVNVFDGLPAHDDDPDLHGTQDKTQTQPSHAEETPLPPRLNTPSPLPDRGQEEQVQMDSQPLVPELHVAEPLLSPSTSKPSGHDDGNDNTIGEATAAVPSGQASSASGEDQALPVSSQPSLKVSNLASSSSGPSESTSGRRDPASQRSRAHFKKPNTPTKPHLGGESNKRTRKLNRSASRDSGNESASSGENVHIPKKKAKKPTEKQGDTTTTTAAMQVVHEGYNYHIILPNRFRVKPNVAEGRNCQVCGLKAHKKECPYINYMKRKRGNDPDAWDVACDYPFCNDKKRHKTVMCPSLHARCYTCHVRGHTSDYCYVPMNTKERAYKAHCHKGFLTKRALTRPELVAALVADGATGLTEDKLPGKDHYNPQWKFSPPCEPWTLPQVPFLGQTYAVDWNATRAAEFLALPDMPADPQQKNVPCKKYWLDLEDRL